MNISTTKVLLFVGAFAATAIAQQPTEQTGQRSADALVAAAPPGFGTYQDHDGTVRAEGPQFRAVLSAHAAELSVPAPTADAELPTLSLRYLGCRRGNQVDLVSDHSAPRLTDDVARYHRGSVVETYTINARGFEQSFHLAQRPAGYGDLVFDIAVEGNVTCKPAALAHQALEFSLGDQRAIRYGEAIAFDRQGLRVEVCTSYDGSGHLQLVVPASFVNAATFPIVVDPVVTPVFLPAGTTWDDKECDVAYDIDHDLYMVVWSRRFSATSVGIRARIFDADGNPVTSDLYISTGPTHASPSVAPCNSLTGGAFLVVWQQGNNIVGRMLGATSGSFLANTFTISSPPTGQQDRRPTVSGPGTGAMMVAWDRTPSGAVHPNQIVMRDFYLTNPTSPSSVNLNSEHVLQTVTAGYVQSVRLAKSDVRTMVGGVSYYANRAVWQRWYTTPAPGDFDVHSCAFRVKRSPFDYVVTDFASAVPGAGSVGDMEHSPDIGARATLHQSGGDIQYLIAWSDEGDIVGHMMNLTSATGAAITVQDTINPAYSPAVGAGFCEFTVAYEEATAEFIAEIRAARVLLDGTVAVTDRLVDGASSNFGLRATSRPIHTVSEDESNRVLLAWNGYGTLGDIRAAYFEPVTVFVTPFGSPCPGPLGELSIIGTAGGLPHAGNDDFAFTVSDAPAFSLAVLLVSDQFTTTPIPGAPGCNLYAGLPLISIFPTVTTATGYGTVPLPMPCSIPHGASLAFQWAIYSPSANAFGWIVSNDIDLYWSHN